MNMSDKKTDVCGAERTNTVEDTSQDVGYTLAANIVSLRYEEIPDTVVEVTKKTILDTLGTIIGGSGAGTGVKEVVDLVKAGKRRRCTEESSVIAFNFKTNAWSAAFAMGAMAHALDYDNVHDDAFTHPSSCTVPAALAVADRAHATGKEFIAAMALGDDLHCRLAYSLSRIGDPAVGTLVAAACAWRICGCRRMRKTVGI